MVSITQLKRQIARERSRLENQRRAVEMQGEKKKLMRELGILKNPTKRRFYVLKQNVKTGASEVGKKLYNLAKNQAILIKQQNERERKDLKKNPKKYANTNPFGLNF